MLHLGHHDDDDHGDGDRLFRVNLIVMQQQQQPILNLFWTGIDRTRGPSIFARFDFLYHLQGVQTGVALQLASWVVVMAKLLVVVWLNYCCNKI